MLIDVQNLFFPSEIVDQVLIVNQNAQQNLINETTSFKVALLINLALKNAADFYESYSVNKGMNLKIFRSMDKAKD